MHLSAMISKNREVQNMQEGGLFQIIILFYNYRKKATHKQVLILVIETYLYTSELPLIWYMIFYLSWWPFPGLTPVCPCFLCTGRPRTYPSTPGRVQPVLHRQAWSPSLTSWAHCDAMPHTSFSNRLLSQIRYWCSNFTFSLHKQYFYFCFSTGRNKVS